MVQHVEQPRGNAKEEGAADLEGFNTFRQAVALHRSIARGFGKRQIKSFLIAPGFVRTDMAQDFMDEYGEDYALNDIALPKLTEPSDLAPMVTLPRRRR